MKSLACGLFAVVAISLLPQASIAQDDDATAIREAALAAGDPEAGMKVFRKCQACHKIGDGAKNSVGPMLNGIVGAQIGSVEGYKYTESFVEKNAAGEIWTLESLNVYLTKPRDFVEKTKMTFPGLKKEDERNDVIAYLASFDGEE